MPPVEEQTLHNRKAELAERAFRLIPELRIRKTAKIPLVSGPERRNLLISIAVILFLYIAATIHSGYNPFSILKARERLWDFMVNDLLPPVWENWQVVQAGLIQTVLMALAATLFSSLIAFVLAILGSNSTAPWKPLTYIIRTIASILRNIPSMIWVFIMTMSFGIGVTIGFLALLINGIGMLTRNFIEVLDETGEANLAVMRTVGAPYLPMLTQSVFPRSLPGILSWILYALEVNIRSAGIVGSVGGGGIGMVLTGYIKSFRYDNALGVILLISAMTILVDRITNVVRERVIV